jgi:hypothetical protein
MMAARGRDAGAGGVAGAIAGLAAGFFLASPAEKPPVDIGPIPVFETMAEARSALKAAVTQHHAVCVVDRSERDCRDAAMDRNKIRHAIYMMKLSG